MIIERALAAAGPGSVLAHRPAGVAHVVGPGPLTPSGEYIPRARRAVCRTRTKQLRVVDLSQSFSSLQHPSQVGRLPRLCARCSACLSSLAPASPRRAAKGQAEQHPPLHRDALRAHHCHLTRGDLWAAAWMAETTAELDTVAWLSLLVHGGGACSQRIPAGRRFAGWSLNRLIGHRRRELYHSLTAPSAERDAAIRDQVATRNRQDRADAAALAQQRRDALRPDFNHGRVNTHLTRPRQSGAPL